MYLGHAACGILVPQLGNMPLALEVWSLNHWTTRQIPAFMELNDKLNESKIFNHLSFFYYPSQATNIMSFDFFCFIKNLHI